MRCPLGGTGSSPQEMTAKTRECSGSRSPEAGRVLLLISKNSDQSKIGSSYSNGTHDQIMGHHGDGCAVTLHPRFSTGLSPEAPNVQTCGALLGVQGGQRALPLSSLRAEQQPHSPAPESAADTTGCTET